MEKTIDGTLFMAIQASEFAHAYAANKPFPHVVLKNSWNEAFLLKVSKECAGFTNWDEEKYFSGATGKRSCGTLSKIPPHTSKLISYCNGPDFLKTLEALTGEKGLIPDPYLLGGGIHSTINRGFLKMHVDFNWHEELNLYRRLNLLIYLNKGWKEDWGGELLLARKTQDGLFIETSVKPHFNTTVIFTTTDHSYHGHPYPMLLPVDRARNSIALYYYVAKRPQGTAEERHTTTKYRINI